MAAARITGARCPTFRTNPKDELRPTMPTDSERLDRGLPSTYYVWLGGALASQLGDAAMYFALGWAAAAFGGATSGVILACVVLPRTLLLLVGGVAGDRWGPRRIMIIGDAAMLAITVVLAALAAIDSITVAVLIAAALAFGTVDAFYLPSAGSMPRRLVPDHGLPRAVALRQAGSQLVLVIGGPLGGAAVALAGFGLVAVIDAITFAAVLAVLIAIKPALPAEQVPAPRRMHREIADGVRVVARTPSLGAALILVAGVAGLIIPLGSLLLPLIFMQHGWPVASAGAVIGAQAAATVVVTLAVARVGIADRLGWAAVFGLLLAVAGELAIALAGDRVVLTAGAVAVGCGIGVFTTHLSPLLLGSAPLSHLARIQSLLSIAQSSSLLVGNLVLGQLASGFGAQQATAVCALLLLGIAIVAMGLPGIRRIRREAAIPG